MVMRLIFNIYLLIIIPCFATITLDTASGTLVPAARKVMPITESGIFSVSPEEKKTKSIYIKTLSQKFYMMKEDFLVKIFSFVIFQLLTRDMHC